MSIPSIALAVGVSVVGWTIALPLVLLLPTPRKK